LSQHPDIVNFRHAENGRRKRTHKETAMKKKGGKAKKRGKAKDLSVRKGGTVKGGLSSARMKA
jgi:hypothetical protein